MRIALDVSMMGVGCGVPTYAEHLLRALERVGGHSLVLWCVSLRARPHVRRLAPLGASIIEPAFLGRILARLGLFAMANPLPIECVAGPVDVFHGLNYLLPSHWGQAARIITVHDLSLLHHPEWHPVSRVWVHRRPLRRTICGAHHVITDTEAIRAEVIERVGVAPERVTAIHLAPAPDFRPQRDEDHRATLDRYGLSARGYLLFVGALEPRKNLGRLLDALDLLRQRRLDVPPLVVVGPPGWRNAEIRARALASPKAVRLLGYLPQDEVVAVMGGAAVFTMPSLDEGFGLPVLEAMACGTPVLTSRGGALEEVAGDAAVLVDPTEVEDIAAGLERILSDSRLRADLSRRGLSRAAEFSWERAARETIRVYERTLRSR